VWYSLATLEDGRTTMRVQIRTGKVQGRTYYNVVIFGTTQVLYSGGRQGCLQYAREQGWKVVSG
jgi:hypothetical protein